MRAEPVFADADETVATGSVDLMQVWLRSASHPQDPLHDMRVEALRRLQGGMPVGPFEDIREDLQGRAVQMEASPVLLVKNVTLQDRLD